MWPWSPISQVLCCSSTRTYLLQLRPQGTFPWLWRTGVEVQPPKSGKSALGTRLFLLATQGLFKRWFNSFRWGKYPPVHNLYFKFNCVKMIGEVTRQGGPAARSGGRAVFIINSDIYLSESCLLDCKKVAKKNQPNIQKGAKFQKLLLNVYFLIFQR